MRYALIAIDWSRCRVSTIPTPCLEDLLRSRMMRLDDTIIYAELIIYIQNSVTLSYRLVYIYNEYQHKKTVNSCCYYYISTEVWYGMYKMMYELNLWILGN